MALKCTAILCCIVLHCTKHQDCFGLQFTAFIVLSLYLLAQHFIAKDTVRCSAVHSNALSFLGNISMWLTAKSNT